MGLLPAKPAGVLLSYTAPDSQEKRSFKETLS